MDSGGGNTGSSDPAKTSTAENAANSLPGCGCSSANNITVRVTPTTGGQFDLQVAKTESVENFKKLISKKLKVPKERICLLHRDRQLREGTLQENQLMDGSRLTLLPSVETGLLAQRPEQSVMQALESLNDTQVNDFLSGKAPLNLTMRLGDHMMLIQLQLSTVTPSSSRRSSGGSGGSGGSSSSTSTSSTSTPAASAGSSSSSSSSSPAFSASPSPSPSASPSKSSFGAPTAPAAAGVSSPLPPSLASPSLSSVIAAAAGSLAAMNSCSSPNGGGFAPDSSRTAAWGSKAPSSAVPTPAPASPRTPFSAAPADVPAFHPASPCAAAPSPDASPHPSPLKFLEEAANLLPKPPPPAPPSAADGPAPAAAASAVTAVSTAAAAPATVSSPSFQQASTSASATSSTSSSSASSASSSQHSCAFGAGSSACKCDAPSAKPTLDTRALAEASRNLTQTLKQLSSEVLTSRSDAAEDSTRGGRRQGAIIESMHHHGKGVYSGTFSGTLNPALQDRYGRPKRDISTIIHILNDLLCATPQYRRHTRQGHSISVETSGSTVPKKGTNTSDKSSSNLEFMEDSGSLSRENQATRGKMEHLRLIMEERRARRRARREARAAPYTTQWSAKSESLPQSSAMGHDTVEPMETGEQSSSSSSSEQQLCELNPPEPVVA